MYNEVFDVQVVFPEEGLDGELHRIKRHPGMNWATGWCMEFGEGRTKEDRARFLICKSLTVYEIDRVMKVLNRS